MDPGTITKLSLMGVSVFAKTVDTCIAAYKAYKISASFGEDWVAADRRFTIQLAKLKTLSQTPISWFENDFRNEQDELTIAVKMQLVDIEGHFIKCRNIIKKYHKQEKALGYQEDKAQELLEEQGRKNSQQPLPKPGKKSAPLRKLAFWKSSNKEKSMSITSTTSEAASLASGSSAAQSKASMKTRDETLTPASTLSQIEGADEVQLPEASEGSFVSEELAIANAEAKKRQSALGLYNRLRWVDHDRNEFHRLLKCIEKGNQQLESLLTLRSGVDPSSILGPVDTEELNRKMADVKHIQLGLRRLHGALARSNSPRNATEAGMHFSIQVHEEPEKLAADLLESSENLPIIIGESWIFTLHGHMAGTPESESTLLYVESETPSPTPSFNEEPGGDLSNIHHKLVELVSNDELDEYQVLGRMRSSNTSLDSHLVIAHTLSKWGAPRHLKAVLSDSQYAQSKATERLQLARLMTVGFIYMKEVLAATERYPRPDRILFYSQASDPDAEPYSTDNELEEILNPFLSIGLGQKKAGARRPVGTTSGLAKRSVNSLAELSLVLFQVASGMALEYGAGDTGFREAVKEARLNLHKIDERCGPLVTEVVQLCLDKSTGEDLFKPGGEEEDRFMERLRRRYQKREEAVR